MIIKKKKALWASIGATAAMSLLLSSCLSEPMKDRISPEDSYNTPARLYLNTVGTLYNYIGGNEDSNGLQGTYRGVYDYNTFTCDEAIIPIRGGDWYDGGFWERLFTQQWTEKDSELYATWCYLYKVVMLCNQSSEALKAHKAVLTDEQYQSYNAEIRALRAMYYFYLLDMFGNIPLVTSTSLKVSEVTKTPRNEVFSFVFKELQEASKHLANEHSNYEGAYYGRITKPVAYFLLAKLALNAEVYTCNKPGTETRKNGASIYFDVEGSKKNAWETTQYYCNEITKAGYSLENSYASNFKVYNETSKENIFTIPMDKNKYANQFQYLFRSRNYNHGRALGLGSENGACATVSTVKAFGYGTTSVDPRYELNFYSDTVKVDNKIVRNEDGTPLVYLPLAVELNLTYSPYIKNAGARMKKYEIDRKAYSDGKLQDNDIVLFRYADVLLMLCEAKVRNGESGDNELNLVRQRVGASNRTATLENILNERLMELMWEGWRRSDLIRFNKFNKDTKGKSGDKTLFPIPYEAKELNPNLK